MNLPLILLGAVGAYYLVKDKKSITTSLEQKICESKDNGFIYDCKSLTIINEEQFRVYNKYIVESTIIKNSEFKKNNAININIKNFTLCCFELLNKSCYNKTIKNKLTKQESILIAIFTIEFVRIYLGLMFGSVSGQAWWTEGKFTDQEKISYDTWYTTFIKPQLSQFFTELDITDENIELAVKQLNSTYKYP